MDDIEELMGSLSHNEVYIVHPGRHFDDEDSSLANDVILTGLHMLTFGSNSPLKQFNQTIFTHQRRRQIRTLIGPRSGQEEPVIHGGACMPVHVHNLVAC